MASDPKYWNKKAEQDYPDNWDPPIAELPGRQAASSDDDIDNMVAYKAGWESARRRGGD